MVTRNVQEIAASCTRFLRGHRARSVRARMQEVADSPLSLIRNDGYGRGGVVAQLEEEVAALLGKEAAVFMPSGTMAQPIALRIWSDLTGTKTVAFHPTCHLQIHEHLAYRALHDLRAVLLGEPDRLFTLEDLQAVDEAVSTLLIELPQREIGGQLPSWEELSTICEESRARRMRLHMDGARLWECAPFYGRTYAEIAAPFDSVYVSFYKVLDGLPGAMLAGPKSFVDEARIWQRRQGGNLQQQSPSAIAAKLGMERHLPLIPAYVAKAREIADALRPLPGLSIVPEHPPTNMMHLYLEGDPDRWVDAALQVAEETRVGLFFHLPDTGKLELTVGDGTLDIGTEEIKALFERVFELAAV
ncbi:MAG: threonine aldolase family protein [Fimbriimonas sp.]